MRFKLDPGDRPWHRWFAWHPVRVDSFFVWWEPVERLTTNCQGYICHSYRLLPEAEPKGDTP